MIREVWIWTGKEMISRNDHTMEYYSAVKKNSFESVLIRWMKLVPIIQSVVSQKDKEHYSILTHIYMEFRKMVMITLYAKQKKRHRCTEQTFGLSGRKRVGCFKRTASKHVYYLGWNRSPAQVGCTRQVLGPGALGRPRGIGWRGRWEGVLGWGIHVYPWLIHFNVWQKPLQYCKVISLQPIF